MVIPSLESSNITRNADADWVPWGRASRQHRRSIPEPSTSLSTLDGPTAFPYPAQELGRHRPIAVDGALARPHRASDPAPDTVSDPLEAA
jgi:hypothetical protein